MPELVVAKRTVVSMRDYARAVIEAWDTVSPDVPLQKASVAVLWAQYMIETGGRACWNWNVGNVKHANGDGHDWHALRNTWEGVDDAVAKKLVAQGLATLDTDKSHIAAMPKGKTAVVYQPPHPATLFAAYNSLGEAMRSHLVFLSKKYGRAWAHVVDGDFRAFAKTLKEGRDGVEGTWDDYYTASSKAYADGMAGHYQNFMVASAFEVETAALVPDDVPTDPAPVVDFDIVRPWHYFSDDE